MAEKTPTRPYWRADALVDSVLGRFRSALVARDRQRAEDAFFLTTHYYARSLLLLRRAFEEDREPLAEAVIGNLLTLDAALGGMHRDAPAWIPLALPLTEAFHDRFVRSLIVRILEEDGEPLSITALRTRLLEFALLGDLDAKEVKGHVRVLERAGRLDVTEDAHIQTTEHRGWDPNTDAAILATMVGTSLAKALGARGFNGITDVVQRPDDLAATVKELTGFGDRVALGFVELARAFSDEQQATASSVWDVWDLLGSGFPRPYQIEAFHMFRAHGYSKAVIEAPTASGKTFIGMLCMQDWFGSLARGESILVVVPTNAYQQQWFRELCFGNVGLRLAPELVGIGAPGDLSRSWARGNRPPVLLITYRGLGQLERTGDVGRFVRALGIRHVILDEVHKVTGEPEGETARSVGSLARMVGEKLESLIGFSGTAEPYREEFEALGLSIIHVVPMVELVASGYVAPFAEFGVPFAFSERELQIRALLARFAKLVHAFADALGSERLRKRFAALSMERRVDVAVNHLRMYRGRGDARGAAAARLAKWQEGGLLKASEFDLITILQICEGISDRKLASEARATLPDGFWQEAVEIRRDLARLLEKTLYRPVLEVARFGEIKMSFKPNVDEAEDDLVLALSMAGLHGVLSSWYYRVGEGRVSAVKAIIGAERSVRPITGVIVFDSARRLDWKRERVQPGYAGVAGLFAELLGDDEVVALGALAGELYLPQISGLDLPAYAAEFVIERLLVGDIGRVLSELLLADLAVHPRAAERVRDAVAMQLRDYAKRAKPRPTVEDFHAAVTRPLRMAFGHRQRGVPVPAAARLRRRMRRSYLPLRFLTGLANDYVWLAGHVKSALPRELVQSDGTVRGYYVVRMPSGRRKHIVYDLVAQLVDDPEAPTNAVVVSSWARTGWNVIRPNVLIDATATRDVTAWQQLRGRAMRALRTWRNEHSLLLGRLVALPSSGRADVPLTREELRLTRTVVRSSERARLTEKGLDGFSPPERMSLGVRLIRKYNKVTHVYELLKATGSEPQITLSRDSAEWTRKPEIQAKHAKEASVDPISGELVLDDSHAPMVYATDPRSDPPEQLEASLREVLAPADPRIITGWLRAALNRGSPGE